MRVTIPLLIWAIALPFITACHPDNNPTAQIDSPAAANLDDPADELVDADLSEDGLIAPTAPVLSITASDSQLQFTWRSDMAATQINLYQYDDRSRLEVLVQVDIPPASTSAQLDVVVHKLAWEQTRYRIELCDADDCISSERVPLTGLLNMAIASLAPETSVKSDKFGAAVASDNDGNVVAIAAPGSRSVHVQFHNDKGWHSAKPLTSSLFATSSPGNYKLSMSAQGNTIAVATLSTDSMMKIVLFDRLGEHWIETASITPADQTVIANGAAFDLALSDDAERLIAGAGNSALTVFERTDSGWLNTAELNVPSGRTRLASFAGSGSLERINLISTGDSYIELHQYLLSGNNWSTGASAIIPMIEQAADTVVVSSADGKQVAIGGWESVANVTSASLRTPVVWRYQSSGSGALLTWFVADSIRLPGTSERSARLRLAADNTLNHIATGWQGESDADLDVYSTDATQWQANIALPDALSIAAKSTFIDSLAFSGDSSALLIGSAKPTPGVNTNPGGLVRLLD